MTKFEEWLKENWDLDWESLEVHPSDMSYWLEGAYKAGYKEGFSSAIRYSLETR